MPRFSPRYFLCCLALAGCLTGAAFVLPTPARAQDAVTTAPAQPSRKRVALVIGNTNYGGGNQLVNPVNDAKAMAKTLRTLGFTVLDFYDLDARKMTDAVESFRAKLDSNTVALFYFSGHGTQVGGENYLVPVGFTYTTASAMPFDALPAARVTAMLGDVGTPINIVIIDACRNNPFEGKRGGSRGLSFLKAETGTLIAYATAPGSTADDNNTGTNGLYTSALLAEIVKPGVSIETVFKRVRIAVKTQSNNTQTPWESSSLSDDFYFVEGGAVAVTPAKPVDSIGGTSAEVNTKARLKVTCNAPNFTASIGGKSLADGVYAVNLLDDDKTTVSVKITAPGYEGKIVSATLERGTLLPLAVILEAIATPEPMPEPVLVPPPSSTVKTKEMLTLNSDTQRVRCVAFSSDGERVAIGGGDKVEIWDAIIGRKLVSIEAHIGWLTTVMFSPDGRQLLTTSTDQEAKVWDATSGKRLSVFKGHGKYLLCAAFSADGKRVVTGGADNTAKIWDVTTGKLLTTLKGHEDYVLSVAFSPDGRRVLTGSKDKTARVWKVSSGELILILGHRFGVHTASFSPDGLNIVTASADCKANVWNSVTGNLQIIFNGLPNRVTSASFSPNGKRVIIGSADKTAKIWDVASGNVFC